MPLPQKNEGVHAVAHFFAALFEVLTADPGSPEAIFAETVQAIVNQTFRLNRPLVTAPHRVPVCRLLPEAYRYGETGDLAPLIDAIQAIDPLLLWRWNPNYSDEKMGAGYMENYGYANVMGGLGLIPSIDAAIGIGLWGSGLKYPLHHHPAEELYLLLGAPTTFYTERKGWQLVPTGGLVHCRPWEKHAMEFNDGPSLVAYLWQGDVRVNAELVE